jgi:hypothetical protein
MTREPRSARCAFRIERLDESGDLSVSSVLRGLAIGVASSGPQVAEACREGRGQLKVSTTRGQGKIES